MNGLELSRGYYEEFGKPMLEADFSEYLKYLAVGFVGSGSDRYGYDDNVSHDHDFEPGFCIFLPGEDIIDRRIEFQLERAYAKLPKEYNGVKRQMISPVGGNRNGVMRTTDFYLSAVGEKDGGLSADAWLRIPDYALAEATNGEVFFDNYGEFTAIRKNLLNMPQDIKLKRLAGNLLIMAQSGQYNFNRCVLHGEKEASQLAINEFVTSAMKAAFLLGGKYMPYYKWSFRALRAFDTYLADKLSILLLGGDVQNSEKSDIIEEIASYIISVISKMNLTNAVCGDLEKHAYSVNDKIEDGEIRNMHILSAV